MTGEKLNLARAGAKGGQLFTPLGFHRGRYFFKSGGMVTWWSAGDLSRIGAALAIVPDIYHWRAMYPLDGGRPGAVDWERVGAELICMAQKAGAYLPGPGEGPAPVGRPRLSEEGRACRQAERQANKATPSARATARSE